MLAVRVKRERTESLRQDLLKLGLLDTQRRFLVGKRHVEVPVTGLRGLDLEKWDAIAFEQENPIPKNPILNPHAEIAERIPIRRELLGLLPKKWELLGDVLILKLDERLRPFEKEIAKVYSEVLGAKTVLKDTGGIVGETRRPKVRVIWGENTVTVHKENGVLFRFDTKEIMFCSGNIKERIRMATACEEGEVVVDMFAGIGYFSIPMAVHSKPSEVYSIEMNPKAFEYLCENVRLNGVEDVVLPIAGDCLEVAPEGIATRIVMGFLRGGDIYLPKAMKVVGEEGIIHYHETCPNELLPDRPISTVVKAARLVGREVEVLKHSTVKSYAPGISHIVLDIQVR